VTVATPALRRTTSIVAGAPVAWTSSK
jgi:hypothetical protein